MSDSEGYRVLSYLAGIFLLLFGTYIFSGASTEIVRSFPAIKIEAWASGPVEPEQYKGKFVLVEFWATWCRPCIAVMDHMEQLSSRFADDVFLVSLSNESIYTVKKFIQKQGKPSRVAVDFKNETFNKYKVASIPRAILFNPEGAVVWDGHPSSLSVVRLELLIKRNRDLGLDQQVNLIQDQSLGEVANAVPGQTDKSRSSVPEEFFQIIENCVPDFESYVITEDAYTQIKGNLPFVFAELIQIPAANISSSNSINDRCVSVKYKNTMNPKLRFLAAVNLLDRFDIEVEQKLKESDIYWLSVVDSNLLWNASIHQWSPNNTSSKIVGQDYLELDNYTLDQLGLELSKQLDLQISIRDKEHRTIHDWSLEMSNIDLLFNQLIQEYGLAIEKKKGVIQTYRFY